MVGRMKRIVSVAILAVTAALALTGCVKYNVDITVSADNTVSGTIVTGVKEGVAADAGVESDQAAYDQLFEGNPYAQGDPFKEIPFSEDGWVGKSYEFTDVPLDELTAFDTTFTITRNGDVFELSGPAPGSEDTSQFADAEASLTVTFPGKILETNGEVKGNTVTWDLLSQTEPLKATASAEKESKLPLILIIVGAVALAVVVAVAIVMTLKARKASTALDAADDAEVALPAGTEFGAPIVDDVTAPVGAEPPVEIAPVDDAPAADPQAIDGPPAEETKD